MENRVYKGEYEMAWLAEAVSVGEAIMHDACSNFQRATSCSLVERSQSFRLVDVDARIRKTIEGFFFIFFILFIYFERPDGNIPGSLHVEEKHASAWLLITR